MLRATANTAFGIAKQFIFSEEDDEPVLERRTEKGLVITQFLGDEFSANS